MTSDLKRLQCVRPRTVGNAIAILLLAASAASAQKQCKKGVPCGGTCISATKTCHVGASEPQQPTPNGAAHASPDATVPASSADSAWVASSRGHMYYKSSCAGANKLAVKNRVYFRSEADATKAGYSRSHQRGC